MKLRHLLVLPVVLTLLITVSCGPSPESKGISLDVEVLPAMVTDSLYAKINYRFKVTDKFPGLDDDNKIFVHFWRTKTKEMLLQDDHSPEKAFSTWQKGDTLNYSREVYIPSFLDEFDIDFEGHEDVKFSVGIYDPRQSGQKTVLFEKMLSVQSSSLNAPELVYDAGWNQPEVDLKIKDNERQSWRWTRKKGICIVENPRRESLLILRGGVDKAVYQDQKVIVKINDTVVEEFVPRTSSFSRRYVITPDQLGKADEFKLSIETDKIFIPSQLKPGVNDDRELGVQVFFLYFRENVK